MTAELGLPALHKPWTSLRRQREATRFGVLVFIGTEAMFFAAILLTYAAYRGSYPGAFAAAARETSIGLGTANTIVLLTSSLLIAVAAEAAQADIRRLALRCLAGTLLLGVAFLVLKGFEYAKDASEGLVPGVHFRLEPAAALFWTFYWIATGVHALHLVVGISLVAFVLTQAWRHRRPLTSPAFSAVALYWHFVDAVWVLLYALIYLPGRA